MVDFEAARPTLSAGQAILSQRIDLVLKKAELGEIYNIGGHNERYNIEIVKIIIKHLKNSVNSKIDESLIKFVEDRKGHDRRYAIAPEKIKKDLDWEPEISFEKGIKKTIDWYVNNKDWLKNVESQEYLDYYNSMYNLL